MAPMKYPHVLSEHQTMFEAVHKRMSIARVGDGELRLALEQGKSISQDPCQALAKELRALLKGPTHSLVCIPNAQAPNRKPVMWGPTRYSAPEYVSLYGDHIYGSSFVTRPDSAPWIDTDDYWLQVRELWYDRDVTLVIGERGGSLTHLVHARSTRLIYGPERNAYDVIDKLEEQIGTPSHSVLICLGACATVLAERLARKGVHALDLGHVGKAMPQKFLH